MQGDVWRGQWAHQAAAPLLGGAGAYRRGVARCLGGLLLRLLELSHAPWELDVPFYMHRVQVLG